MAPDDLALRCNIIELEDGRIVNHHGGHLKTKEGDALMRYLDEQLGDSRVKFVTGIQYRHLLIIKGRQQAHYCVRRPDYPNEPWKGLLV